ncbi:MAG TPA: hypothetical protein DCQ50_17310 [Chryseobacterium sp.]|nr:hypothetical protein [Chryseobacterium sp.]
MPTTVTPLNTILSWFQTDDFPTELQFANSWSSFWHKYDKLPMSSIDGLAQMFQQTASSEVLQGHIHDDTAHDSTLAKLDAANLTQNNIDAWKLKLQIPVLPENIGTVDNNELFGNVYTKQYISDNYIKYKSDAVKRISSNGVDYTGKIMRDAFVAGFNVLPNYVGKDEGEPLYNARYIVQGTDIFHDFTGDTDYRPSHPAHDSLIAYGSKIGKGFVDGTNYTLVGTALYELNDVAIGDSVTAFGNNIANAKGIYGNPNRTAIASNGFDLRNMMNNNVTVGNLIWSGDIHSSVIMGYNVRHYRYIFNSLVMGGNLYDAYGKYPNETNDYYLDNDIMIGFGFSKDPHRHPATHNLLIGSHEHYGNGSPDFNYRPLVEGNFKQKYFGINGRSINYIQDFLNKVPTEEIQLSLVSSPVAANSSYNAETKKLTLNGVPGNYRLFEGLTVGESYLISITSSIGTSGSWGFEIGSSVDSGNGDWYTVNNKLVEVTNSSNAHFDILIDGNASGEMTVKLLHIKNYEVQVPVYEIRDFNNEVTFEMRTSNGADDHISFGKNSGGKYASGTNSSIFGTNSLTMANSIETSAIFGNYNLKMAKTSRLNNIFGINNLNVASLAHRVTAVGQQIAPNAMNLTSSIVLGWQALNKFKGTFVDGNIWNEIIAIGNGAGFNVEESQRSIFIGDATGNSKNVYQSTIIGNRSTFKDVNNSNNEIVIGANTVGNGDNTATIGNTSVQSVHLSNIVKADRNTGITGNSVFPATNDADFIQRKHLIETRPYKVYTGMIVCTGTPAQPDFSIFENTVGNIIWSRTGDGQFVGTLNGAFPAGKVWSVSTVNTTSGTDQKLSICGRIDNNTIYVRLLDIYGASVDMIGEIGSFEFRIYN